MKKVFVEIEVPEGEHCEDLGADSDFNCNYFDMNQDDEHYCQVFNRLCSHNSGKQMYSKKLPECLALPSLMKCGHHPDALAQTTYYGLKEKQVSYWCVRCEQGEKL